MDLLEIERGKIIFINLILPSSYEVIFLEISFVIIDLSHGCTVYKLLAGALLSPNVHHVNIS